MVAAQIPDAGPFMIFPPIVAHGVIGDRRTAALVAADGTIDWLCLPRFDGSPLFGVLLDPETGGHWRIGPAIPTLGDQRYTDRGTAVITRWEDGAATLELTDLMLWPEDDRDGALGGESARAVVRSVTCTGAAVTCRHTLQPGGLFSPTPDFVRAPREVTPTIALDDQTLSLWSSHPLTLSPGAGQIDDTVTLRPGDTWWTVLAPGGSGSWDLDRVTAEVERTTRYWHDWASTLECHGPRAERLRRTAITVHLLSYAETGSPVAAPTTSLPERIGGDLNWDYRYSWVRDASLSVATLSRLGDIRNARRYLDCLASYRSSSDLPLQIVYGVDGGLDLPVTEYEDVRGYRDSAPVLTGNRACGQIQFDSLGFFIESAAVYLQEGGDWDEDQWHMVRRSADYIADHWREPDSGIWELPEPRQYVGSKVMCWSGLGRAVDVARAGRRTDEVDRWRATMDAIRQEVMDRGWNAGAGVLRQVYDDDGGIDASALLAGVTGFFAPDDPRLTSTVERVVERLGQGGFVHRFDPTMMPLEAGGSDLPIGSFEGAFLPCTFWLAIVYARMGRVDEAEATIARVEALAGDLGLFAEEVDVATGAFLGNTPLLFSQVEYARAVLALDEATSASPGQPTWRRDSPGS